MNVNINVEVTLTFSKIMAFLLLITSFILDLITTKNGAVTMFAIPFIVILVTGKQYFDRKKE